jgi:hypothetical protein
MRWQTRSGYMLVASGGGGDAICNWELEPVEQEKPKGVKTTYLKI